MGTLLAVSPGVWMELGYRYAGLNPWHRVLWFMWRGQQQCKACTHAWAPRLPSRTSAPCCAVRASPCATCAPHTCRLSAWGAFFNETFSATPDFPDHPKTLRHTLSPVFAHHAHRGSAERPGYRWMLVGDDDTGGRVRGRGLVTHGSARVGGGRPSFHVYYQSKGSKFRTSG